MDRNTEVLRQKRGVHLPSKFTYLLTCKWREQLFPSIWPWVNRNILGAIIYILLLQLWLSLNIMTLKHNFDTLLNHWSRIIAYSVVCPRIMDFTVLKNSSWIGHKWDAWTLPINQTLISQKLLLIWWCWIQIWHNLAEVSKQRLNYNLGKSRKHHFSHELSIF